MKCQDLAYVVSASAILAASEASAQVAGAPRAPIPFIPLLLIVVAIVVVLFLGKRFGRKQDGGGYGVKVKCPKCSSENSAAAKFCRACGNTLEEQERPSKPRENTVELWRARLWGTGLRKGGTITVAAAAVLALYFGFFRPKVEISLANVHSDSGVCEVEGWIINRTKYRFNSATFTIPPFFSIPFVADREVPAGMQASSIFGRINLAGTTIRTCEDLVKVLRENRRSASVMACSMPNVPEGDCQSLVSVSVPSGFEFMGAKLY